VDDARCAHQRRARVLVGSIAAEHAVERADLVAPERLNERMNETDLLSTSCAQTRVLHSGLCGRSGCSAQLPFDLGVHLEGCKLGSVVERQLGLALCIVNPSP